MASHFYGVDLGHGIDRNNVTTGTSSTASLDVELRVLDGVAGQNKKNVLIAIEAIKAKIVAGDAPA